MFKLVPGKYCETCLNQTLWKLQTCVKQATYLDSKLKESRQRKPSNLNSCLNQTNSWVPWEFGLVMNGNLYNQEPVVSFTKCLSEISVVNYEAPMSFPLKFPHLWSILDYQFFVKSVEDSIFIWCILTLLKWTLLFQCKLVQGQLLPTCVLHVLT